MLDGERREAFGFRGAGSFASRRRALGRATPSFSEFRGSGSNQVVRITVSTGLPGGVVKRSPEAYPFVGRLPWRASARNGRQAGEWVAVPEACRVKLQRGKRSEEEEVRLFAVRTGAFEGRKTSKSAGERPWRLLEVVGEIGTTVVTTGLMNVNQIGRGRSRSRTAGTGRPGDVSGELARSGGSRRGAESGVERPAAERRRSLVRNGRGVSAPKGVRIFERCKLQRPKIPWA